MLSKRRTHLEKQMLIQDDDQETRYRNTKRTRILDAIKTSPSIHSSYSRSTRPRSTASVASEKISLYEPPQPSADPPALADPSADPSADPLADPVPLQSPAPSVREGSVLSDVDSVFSLGESATHAPAAGNTSYTFAEHYRASRKPRKELEWEPMDDDIRLQIDNLLKDVMDSALKEDIRNSLEVREELRKYIRACKKRISRTPIPSYAKAKLFDTSHLQQQIAQWEEKLGPLVNGAVYIRERAIAEEDALDDELRKLSQSREEYRNKVAQEKEVKRQVESLHALINIPPARDDYIVALTQCPSSKFSNTIE